MRFPSGVRSVFLFGTIFAICLFGLAVFSQAEAQEEEKGFNLGQVVVTATKTEHTLGDVPIAVEVITKEEIKAKNIKTVQDALKYLTGVEINKSCGTWGDKGKVQLQGLDEKHTLILVDGQRFLGGHGSAVDLQQIPIDMIERIEVVKGPASALYGSDAIGGVINIITKSAPEKPFISASTSFGSRRTQIHEVSGGFKKDKFGSFFDYVYRESDGVQHEFYYTDSKGRLRKSSDWYKEDILQGSLSYEFSPQSRVFLKPYYSKHIMKDEITYQAKLQNRIQERVGLNSIWEWSPDELSKLKLRGSLFSYEHRTTDKDSDWDNDNYEVELNYSRLVFDNHTLSGGCHYHKEDVDDRGKAYEADQTLYSFFVQDEIDFSPFVLVLGTRIDEHDKWGTEVNPKVSLLYKVTEDFKLRGSVGTAFRAPSLVKLYADGWKMGLWTVHANSDLKPEESIGYQLGAEYTFSEKLLTKLSFFRNEVENLISHKIVSGPPPGPMGDDMYWENIDEATTQGIEFSLASQIIDNLTARLGYTFLDTEDKSTKKELIERPKHKLTLEFDWMIPKIALNVNLAGEYIGRRYADAANTNRLGGYTIFNLALTKDIGEHAQVFARVDNIFGKKNISDEYDIDGTEFLGGLKVKF